MILAMIKSQELTMSFVADSMERRTRKNTFYRKIDQIIDWKPIEDIVTEHDTRGSSAVGREAYPGLLLFKMLLLRMKFHVIFCAMFIALLAGCPLPGSDLVDDITAPGEMLVPTLEEGNGQLIAAWAAPTDDGGSEITGYELQYREADAGEWESAAVIANGDAAGDAGIFTYTITELTNGTEYTVQVRAVNAKGNGAWSESAAATPVAVPMAPTAFTLEADDAHITATWAAPTDDGGSEITGYELQYREAHAGEWESAAVIANGDAAGDAGIFTYTIMELTNGTEYAVRVYAVNAKGNGNPSEILTAIPVTIPSAPNAPTLTHGNNRLTATWNAPNTGGSEILRYELQYREVADPEGMWLDVTTDSEITTTSHTIMGLTNGNSYEVQVRAVNAQGNSPWSGSTTATPDVTPNAPAVPTLTVGNTQLTAAWSTPADNGSTAITGYELQYRAGDRAWTLIVSGIGTSTSHTITGLTNGNSYEVQVRAVNDQGSGPWSGSASATPATIPSTPDSPTLTAGNTQLGVTWTAPNTGGSAITRYELQYLKGNSGAWTLISSGIGTNTSHTITGLTNGNSYKVQVRAVNAQGTGEWSPSASATPVAVPMAPTAPTLAVGNTQLTVAWSAPTDTGGSAITRYELQYRTGGGAWTLISSGIGTRTSHTITGLTNGNSYEVQVSAVNDQGNSPWSRSSTATPNIAPNAPAAPTLTEGNARLTVAWSAPTDNGGTDITRYELQYYQTGRSWQRKIIDSGTSTTHTITGLTNGNSYEVRVRAVNAKGAGPWSGSATATPDIAPRAPAAPTLIVGNTQLGVAWTAPTDNGGTDITRYELQYRRGNGAWTLISSSTRTSHTITGLTNGNSYEVRVRAVNAQGNSPWSGSATATPNIAPNAPAAPTLTVGNTQITVAWTAPTDNGGTDITRYELQYRRGGGAWTLISSSTRTTHTITGLTNGNSYKVQVRAVNAQGAGAWSGSATATPNIAPNAPAAPTLTEGNARLTVAWSAPTDNGGTDITRYELQYRTGSGAWVPISSGTNTSHTITGLTNGNSYEVQVRAVNAQGNSPWSLSAIATPNIAPNAPAAPTLTARDTELGVAWSAPTDNGGTDITGYEVQYRRGGGAWTPISSGIGTNTSHTITGLTNGNSYEVQVRAVNAQGAGAWSGSSTAMLPVFATQVPSGRAVLAILSAAIDTRIATENLTVSLTTVTSPTSTVTPPTVNAGTGIITVTPHTTAGTYLVSGEDGGGTEQFSKHFYVTVSPTTNAELQTAATAGITTWGDTADLNYIITTSVTDMSYMFSGARAFNGDISDWDVSSVTYMSHMFSNATAFNGDLSDWDTGAVTDMSYMFYDADAFNGDISDWDVSSVTNMSSMFRGARAFNGDLSDWDTGTVTDMSEMFRNATAFNGDISDWDVSSVTSMYQMFYYAVAFNGDISDWDVSSVTSMVWMFWVATAFNGDISDWDVSSVTSMVGMFSNADAFNGDISDWDVSSVTYMIEMFRYATAFNGDISGWDVSSVTNMREMFSNADAFNGDISGWDVSSVTEMNGMFYYATAFNGDISDWDVSSVWIMNRMFYEATAFNGDLEEWKEHLTLNSAGKYTGYKSKMFTNSGVTGSLIPSWY